MQMLLIFLICWHSVLSCEPTSEWTNYGNANSADPFYIQFYGATCSRATCDLLNGVTSMEDLSKITNITILPNADLKDFVCIDILNLFSSKKSCALKSSLALVPIKWSMEINSQDFTCRHIEYLDIFGEQLSFAITETTSCCGSTSDTNSLSGQIGAIVAAILCAVVMIVLLIVYRKRLSEVCTGENITTLSNGLSACFKLAASIKTKNVENESTDHQKNNNVAVL